MLLVSSHIMNLSTGLDKPHLLAFPALQLIADGGGGLGALKGGTL